MISLQLTVMLMLMLMLCVSLFTREFSGRPRTTK